MQINKTHPTARKFRLMVDGFMLGWEMHPQTGVSKYKLIRFGKEEKGGF